MNSIVEEKLKHLPTSPGVYQHKDASGKTLYVGKAKNLRNRVRSYFQKGGPADGRIRIMVEKVADIEIILTDTEAEALILENNLIKTLKPRYNVNLRDDKTYPYICIKNERFPRIFPTRRVIRDGSKYFGPYTDVRNMHQILETIRSVFKLRNCNLHLSEANIRNNKFNACLQFHIKKCAAPCIGLQEEGHYTESLSQIRQLLSGKTGALIAQLKQEMRNAAENRRFEQAAELRDKILALEQFSAKQKIVTESEVNRDLFSLYVERDEDVACGVVFQVREGKIVGRRHKYLTQLGEVPDDALLQSFVEDYYAEAVFFPDEVFLATELPNPEPILELLRNATGKKVPLHTPQRGEKAELMRMVEANAKLLTGEFLQAKAKRHEEAIPRSVQSLQRDLHLPRLPKRIECFDISHLSGTGTVASCVVFIDGKPAKNEYRKFKIRSTEGKPDDFLSMHEVITRRFTRVLQEKLEIPDLIIIDGGKGQLSHAVEALKEVGFYGKAPVVSLAKRMEEVFFPEDQKSVMIPRTSSALKLMQQLRDEAHRFAITFQRQQRKNAQLRSELMEIPGIGAKTVEKLLKTFGSVKKIKEANPNALTNTIGLKMALALMKFFETKEDEASLGDK
ncbi:MAG TPA: excinuclease ABC subunit UvrC [Rhodothermales bacterium]|nr:excinuclease ABC subunit UvrC [Rhodothermales bacterium]HRR09245.1 excinuclease ABC subunit UvrC [Rhodothermales bacterium]